MRMTLLALAATAACLVGNCVHAATVQLELVLDPATVGCNGCTLSGPGTYQVFASASQGDNLGIAGYGISIQNVTTVLHRAPRANIEDSEGNIDPAGFTLLRSGNNQVSTGTGFLIGAGQDTITPTPYIIHGFGQRAGGFYEISPGPIIPPIPAPLSTWKAPLLLAEGFYGAGPLPYIDLQNVDVFANLFDSSGGIFSVGRGQLTTYTCLGECGPGPAVAPSVADVSFRTAVMNEVVNLMPVDSAPGTFPVEWSALSGPTYTTFSGNPGPAIVNFTPSWDAAQQKFTWQTGGSLMGHYVWTGTASNSAGSDSFSLTVTVFYPEPGTLSLVGLAALGCLSTARCRLYIVDPVSR